MSELLTNRIYLLKSCVQKPEIQSMSHICACCCGSRNSYLEYVIVNSYGLHSPWFEFRQQQDIFCPPKPSIPTLGYRASFPGVKRPGCDVYHLPPSSAWVGMSGGVLLLTLYAVLAWAGTALPLLLII
jgi:hypothetical protein